MINIFFNISWNYYDLKQNRCCVNSKGCSLIGQILSLLFKDHQFESPKDHQFEFHKFQDYWRLTELLTSGPVRLVDMHASWPNTNVNLIKKNWCCIVAIISKLIGASTHLKLDKSTYSRWSLLCDEKYREEFSCSSWILEFVTSSSRYNYRSIGLRASPRIRGWLV
jgi:hypothetical protein